MSAQAVRVEGRYRTVPELLAAAALAFGERAAFVEAGRVLTFSDWHHRAGALASTLAAAGVVRGDVVCLLLPPSADYACCYQAAMRVGAVTSGVNLRLGPLEIDDIVSRTRPRVTVIGDGADPPRQAGQIIRRSELEQLYRGQPTGPDPSLTPSDPVAVVWTSGTTGRPKGALFDHDNLRAVADGVGVLSRPGDRRISPSPFSHVGYMTRAWDELANGITTVIPGTPWSAGDTLRLIEQERVTVAQGVPTQWALMLAHPDFDAVDMSSLRLAATGSATVPPELVREVKRRLGVPFVVRYTSTEASLTTGTQPDDPDDVVARTVGRPAPNVEIELVDDHGVAVPAGEVGTVRVRSVAVMRGYWDDPERTAEVLSSDGWLLTGDLGHLDGQGNLVLVGRRNEMYVRGGYNVYPAEVEAVLGGHPAVARVAVLGLPDPVLGEIGLAAVVAVPGTNPTRDDLRSWCKARVADYKAPDRLVLVDELPLTPMLKVDKAALARTLCVGQPDGRER